MNVIENADNTLQFIVNADCTPVFEHRAKIERLFSVRLILDIPSPGPSYHWVGLKGGPRDRLNAKIYILSLTKCPSSTCTEEKKIFVPLGISYDVIETVERRTTAAIVPDEFEESVYTVCGSALSVSAAINELDEVVCRDSVPDLSNLTPNNRPNKASRRLSFALQETLTKTNQKGNYINASDAVKRAIASCLLDSDDKQKDDDDDVILIEGDSDNDEDIEAIVIEDDNEDDDVIIVESPWITDDQKDKNDLFFGDNFNENKPTNNQTVEQLTKAFGDMKTPSKSVVKPKNQRITVKAAVKPLNFDNLTKEESTDTSNHTDDSCSRGEVSVTDRKNDDDVKGKKKRTASKLDDDSVDVITINDDTPAAERKGNINIPDDKGGRGSSSKRQRLKSIVIQVNNILDKQSKENIKENETQVKCSENDSVFVASNGLLTKRVQPQKKDSSNDSDKAKEKVPLKRKDLFRDIVNDYTKVNSVAAENETRIVHVTKKDTFPSRENDLEDGGVKEVTREKDAVSSRSKDLVVSKVKDMIREKYIVPGGDTESFGSKNPVVPRVRPSRFSDDLRYIVIDGSNVAMKHGQDRTFSCKGIRLCVDYFRNRGHTMITVFLPHWRKCRPRDLSSVTYRSMLDDLEKEGYLVYTPSRRIGNKLVASYDDRYIIELAEREDGIVVSNDQYRDLLREKHSWRRVIETRLLMFSFVRDHFMPPDDPYGKQGPSLDQLLRRRPLDQDMNFVLKSLQQTDHYYMMGSEREYRAPRH